MADGSRSSEEIGSANNNISYFKAYVCVIKAGMSVGFLYVHILFKVTGWVNTFFNIFFSCILSVAVVHMVCTNKKRICMEEGLERISYAEAMQKSFSNRSRGWTIFGTILKYLVDSFLLLNHLTLCTIHIVFSASGFKDILNEFKFDIDDRLYIIATIVPLLIVLFIYKFRYVVFVALVGDVLIIVAVLIILVFTINYMPSKSNVEAISNRPYLWFSMEPAFFIVGAIGLLLTIEYNMENPQYFTGITGILCIGSFVTIALHTLFGFLVYWTYGKYVQCGLVSNLHVEFVGPIMNFVLSAAILLTYPMHSYVIFDIVWNHHIRNICKENHHQIVKFSINFIIIILTVLLALALILYFDLAFYVTQLYSGALALIFPAIMDLALNYDTESGISKLNLIRDIFLIIMGLLVDLTPIHYYGIASVEC